MEAPLTILYRDDRYVAVHKPSGLLVHRSEIDRHETRFAVQLVRDQLGCRVYPVHRLDKPTSGVLLFGLDSEAASLLGQTFQEQRVTKRYLAVVRGWTPEEGVIDHAFRERFDPYAGRAQPREPLPARSAYRRLACAELPWPVERFPCARYSLVEVLPHTGRKHQIRRHLKHIAHPVIGDTTYGKGLHNRLFAEHLDCHRLLLAAAAVTFAHPFGGEPLTLRAPLEGEFRRVTQDLGWEAAADQATLSTLALEGAGA